MSLFCLPLTTKWSVLPNPHTCRFRHPNRAYTKAMFDFAWAMTRKKVREFPSILTAFLFFLLFITRHVQTLQPFLSACSEWFQKCFCCTDDLCKDTKNGVVNISKFWNKKSKSIFMKTVLCWSHRGHLEFSVWLKTKTIRLTSHLQYYLKTNYLGSEYTPNDQTLQKIDQKAQLARRGGCYTNDTLHM